jgi:CBS domain containing-hemolysin-like protein
VTRATLLSTVDSSGSVTPESNVTLSFGTSGPVSKVNVQVGDHVKAGEIWFLWPLAILAVLVIFFGIVMARSTMRAYNASLAVSNPLRRYMRLQEAIFWGVAGAAGYVVYLLLSAV